MTTIDDIEGRSDTSDWIDGIETAAVRLTPHDGAVKMPTMVQITTADFARLIAIARAAEAEEAGRSSCVEWTPGQIALSAALRGGA